MFPVRQTAGTSKDVLHRPCDDPWSGNVLRERAAAHHSGLAQVFNKEEEICELQVKLRERDSGLRDFKRENSRFADSRDRMQADISLLQRQVSSCAGGGLRLDSRPTWSQMPPCCGRCR